MAWLILITAALLEVIWAVALERSDGLTRLWPSIAALTIANTSLVLLSFALRDLPVGTAYALWTGLGAVGVVTAGIVLLDESVSPVRLACIGLVLLGLMGLRIVE